MPWFILIFSYFALWILGLCLPVLLCEIRGAASLLRLGDGGWLFRRHGLPRSDSHVPLWFWCGWLAVCLSVCTDTWFRHCWCSVLKRLPLENVEIQGLSTAWFLHFNRPNTQLWKLASATLICHICNIRGTRLRIPFIYVKGVCTLLISHNLLSCLVMIMNSVLCFFLYFLSWWNGWNCYSATGKGESKRLRISSFRFWFARTHSLV